MNKPLQKQLAPILIFLVFCLAMALVQFSTSGLADNDGYYHIKMAWLMRTEGLKPGFPYLPLTILNAREFYDHHFLFHVVLIPFTFGDLVIGAKWAAIIFSALAFLAVWHLFEQQKVTYAWLWSLGLLGVSEAFIYRMSIPRAQSLSLAVLALGMTWMLSRKYLKLTALAFVYVWLYDAFPLLLVLAMLHAVAVGLIERRLELRPLLYVSIGLALGMTINPYFPYNLIFVFRHILPKVVDATSTQVGNEWYPYTTGQLLNNSLPSLIVLVSGFFALGLAGSRMNLRTMFALLASLLFGLMLFQARRFVEYFPPFALMFAGFAWQPFFAEVPGQDQWGKERIRLPIVLLLIYVLASGVFSLQAGAKSMQDSRPASLYAGASAWLKANTPQNSRVFQTDWDDFPRLFFYNTHNTYLIGLDPTYMQFSDPKLYDLWVKVTHGQVENIADVVAGKFGAKYIHTDLNHGGFIRRAQADAGLKEVYWDGQEVLFEVIKP
jgi:hypothetical protein